MQTPSLITAFAIGMLFLSCDVSHVPYLKQKVKLEKVGDNCSGKSDTFNMNSNTNGERYTFQECLDASFDGAYTVERKGDTVEVRIGKRPVVQSLYKITLDINTRPAYKFLTINGQTMAITIPRN